MNLSTYRVEGKQFFGAVTDEGRKLQRETVPDTASRKARCGVKQEVAIG